jgi:hypothetical protein
MASGTLRAVLAGFCVFVAIAAVLAFRGGSAVATICTDPPTNLQQPSITGTPAVNAQLTGSIGSWDSGCAVTYAVTWYRAGTPRRGPITLPSGVTTDYYTVQQSDQGYSLVFQVVATNANGNTTAQSPPFPIPGPPPPPPPPAAVTLTRTGDGVSIYQNHQGKYYISDTCSTTGRTTDPGKTIGPGYIYRVDLDGLEVVAPYESDGPPGEPTGDGIIPSSGLGVFLADIWEGDPNNSGYYDNSRPPVWHPGNGRYYSVQGNVCYGDQQNVFFTQDAGVYSSSRDNADPRTEANDYLWASYTVTLQDQYGRLFAIAYWYRFYPDWVDLWVKVTACPEGACAHHPAGPAPFLKMPKIQFTVSGPNMDYYAESCYDVNGGWLWDATQLNNPNGGTSGNHCGFPNRGRIDIWDSVFPHPRFRITARSQALAAFGWNQPTYPWRTEPAETHYGLDKWAIVSGSRQHLNFDMSLDNDKGCGGGALSPPNSASEAQRRWEMGGDNPNPVRHYYPFKTIFAMFKGWEDGNGPPNCRSLYNRMLAGEAYANYFRIQNG